MKNLSGDSSRSRTRNLYDEDDNVLSKEGSSCRMETGADMDVDVAKGIPGLRAQDGCEGIRSAQTGMTIGEDDRGQCSKMNVDEAWFFFFRAGLRIQPWR